MSWLAVLVLALPHEDASPSTGSASSASIGATPHAALSSEAAPVVAVESIGITVSDLDASLAWYERVLDFQPAGAIEEHAGAAAESLEGVFAMRSRSARLTLGDETLELTEYLAPQSRPLPVDSRSNDRWFQHVALIVSDMDAAYARLRTAHVAHASSGPQRLPDWNPNAGGIEAFYFKDPDGHVLEVLEFPAGKGDPRWQRLASTTHALFLGIDHTAIVVADTETSLAFYRDLLGMRVAGTSENFGTEQEHLNGVFGAHLRITALRAERGPGIEFLEYLAPSDGRPYPLDARGCDLVHWETRLAATDLSALLPALVEHDVALVSSGVIETGAGAAALLVRDPDGHAVEFHGSAAREAAAPARR